MTPVMAKIRHRAHRGENIILRLKNILGKLIIAVICHQEQKLVLLYRPFKLPTLLPTYKDIL